MHNSINQDNVPLYHYVLVDYNYPNDDFNQDEFEGLYQFNNYVDQDKWGSEKLIVNYDQTVWQKQLDYEDNCVYRAIAKLNSILPDFTGPEAYFPQGSALVSFQRLNAFPIVKDDISKIYQAFGITSQNIPVISFDTELTEDFNQLYPSEINEIDGSFETLKDFKAAFKKKKIIEKQLYAIIELDIFVLWFYKNDSERQQDKKRWLVANKNDIPMVLKDGFKISEDDSEEYKERIIDEIDNSRININQYIKDLQETQQIIGDSTGLASNTMTGTFNNKTAIAKSLENINNSTIVINKTQTDIKDANKAINDSKKKIIKAKNKIDNFINKEKESNITFYINEINKSNQDIGQIITRINNSITVINNNLNDDKQSITKSIEKLEDETTKIIDQITGEITQNEENLNAEISLIKQNLINNFNNDDQDLVNKINQFCTNLEGWSKSAIDELTTIQQKLQNANDIISDSNTQLTELSSNESILYQLQSNIKDETDDIKDQLDGLELALSEDLEVNDYISAIRNNNDDIIGLTAKLPEIIAEINSIIGKLKIQEINISSQLQDATSYIGSIKSNTNIINGIIDNFSNNINKIEKHIASIKQSNSNIINEIEDNIKLYKKNINTEIHGDAENEIKGIINEIKDINTHVSNINTWVGNINGKITNINDQASYINDELNKITEQVSIIDDKIKINDKNNIIIQDNSKLIENYNNEIYKQNQQNANILLQLIKKYEDLVYYNEMRTGYLANFLPSIGLKNKKLHISELPLNLKMFNTDTLEYPTR